MNIAVSSSNKDADHARPRVRDLQKCKKQQQMCEKFRFLSYFRFSQTDDREQMCAHDAVLNPSTMRSSW